MPFNCLSPRTFVCAILSVATGLTSAAPQWSATGRSLEIRGNAAGDYFGRPILCADFDGDGRGDLVVGADRFTFTPGQRPTLYVFRGKSQYYDADLIDLSTDAADAVILGDTDSDNLATALAAGDINGDGRIDLVAADSTTTAAGRVGAGTAYVLFGKADFFSRTVYDLAAGDWSMKILGAAAGDDMGGSLMFGGLQSKGLALGDITNDGIADLALGAHLADSNGRSDSGKVIVLKGRTSYTAGTVIDLATQSDSVILGNETYNELGTAITIGDLNADGVADLVLGYEYGSITSFSTHGKILVFWGKSSFPASINLASQSPDLQIQGQTSWDSLGAAVAIADVNADGRKDLVATAPGWDHSFSTSVDEGAVYVFFGKTSFPAIINLASQAPDVMVQGYDTANQFGGTLQAGDFNGDGVGDFMFSSRDGGRAGYPGEGRVYVIFGRAGIPGTIAVQNEDVSLIINGDASGFQLADTIGAGDLDGDGADEMLAGTPFLSASTGRLLVFDPVLVPTAARDWQLFE